MDNRGQEIERIEKELYAIHEKIKNLKVLRKQKQPSPTPLSEQIVELEKKERDLQNKQRALK